MGSALGDYIHSSKDTYNRYGTARTLAMGSPNFNVDLQGIRSMLDNTLKEKDTFKNVLQNFENTFNRFLSNDSSGPGISFANVGNIDNFIHSIVEEKLSSAFEEWSVTTNDNITHVGAPQWVNKIRVDELEGRVSTGKIKKGSDTVELKTLVKKIEVLIKAIKQKQHSLSETNVYGDKEMQRDLEKMREIIKEVYILYDTMEDKTYRTLISLTTGTSSRISPQLKGQKRGNKDSKSISKIVSEINDLIELRAKFLPISNVTGLAFELYTAAMKYLQSIYFQGTLEQNLLDDLNNNIVTSTETRDLFKKTITAELLVGDKHEMINKYDKKTFFAEYNGQLFGQADVSVIQEEKVAKIDVAFEWINETTGKTESFKFSNKNVNLDLKHHKWVSVVGGTTLLYILDSLSDKGYGEVVNHWINMRCFTNSGLDNIEGARFSVDQSIALLILYLSLTGSTFGTNSGDEANVFLIANKIKGQVKAYTMRDLLAKKIDTKRPTKDISIDIGSDKYYQYKIANTLVNPNELSDINANIRISRLIDSFKNKSVSVSFHYGKEL